MSAFYLRALLVAAIAVSLASAMKKPDWLSHVDKFKLQEYMGVAQTRHSEAVQTALDNYDVRGPSTLSAEELAREEELRENLKLDEYRINAPGKLPDFHDELGESPVFVTNSETPLFTREECKDVVAMAEEYFTSLDEPAKLPSGQYYIEGFWIKDVPGVKQWFIEKCKSRMFPLLKKKFPDFVDSVEDLVVDNAYLFKYKPEPGLRTEVHTDGGCLSFTFALNEKSEYEGGGTWVEGLTSDDDPDMGQVIEMDVGHCTIRPGGIRHCGNPLKSGTRYIIGGFCMNKKRVEHVRQLGRNCEQRDSPTKIREALECAIALNPEFDSPYSNLAHVYESQGNEQKAMQVMEDCLRLANPKSPSSSYYLGTFQYKQENFEEAARYMQNCLDIDPNDGDALDTLSHCFAGMGDTQKERETLERIVVTPGVSNRALAQAYCNLGILHVGQNDELEFFEKSIQAEPDNLPARHNLGNAFARRHEWDKAVEVFRQVVTEFTETNEQKFTYLKMLYQVATAKLREDNTANTRDEMMAQLASTMGEENLTNLMAMQKAGMR